MSKRYYQVVVLLIISIVLLGCQMDNDPKAEVNDSKTEIMVYEHELNNSGLNGGQILKEGVRQMEVGDNQKAIVALYLYLDEVQEYQRPIFGVHQDVRFELAQLLMAEGREEEAAFVLEEYLERPIMEREVDAREMLAQCNEAMGK